MPFTDHFYDRFVSKGFRSLEKQTLRPFPDELRSFSVQQFVLNTVFCSPFEEKARARSFNVIRRTLNAVEEYDLARASYETIFPNKTVGAYLRALHHFESCVTELFQAFELLFGMIGKKIPDKTTTGSEEILFKLDRIYNTAKHTEHMLLRAQHFKEGDTLAVWISNVGLTSKSYILTFDELHESLCAIANAAAMLANGGQQAAVQPVRNSAQYSLFANSPPGSITERLLGSFEADGAVIFFKIDYYDKNLSHHSPDPSDPSVTERVITIMLAEEY